MLVTGAAGSIGSYFAEHARDRYDLRLMVRGNEKRIEQIRALGEIVTADLGNLDRLKELCRGVDTVLHLAAGTLSFSSQSHQYLDNPAGQPTGSFPITVTVADGPTATIRPFVTTIVAC